MMFEFKRYHALFTSGVAIFASLMFFDTGTAYASDACKSFEPPESVIPILDEKGNFSKILVYGEYFSDSSDVEDVSAAVRAASLKAKATLSKFLGEDTETEDTLVEMSKFLKEKGVEGKKVTTQRLKVEIQQIKSKNKQVLRALLKLSDCYDPTNNRVIVELGTNLSLLKVSNEMQKLFNNNTDGKTNDAGAIGNNSSKQGGFTRQSGAKKKF